MEAVEIEIPRNLVKGLVVVLLTLGIGVLGWWVSPLDAQGRPMLLSPRMVSMRRYYRLVQDWHRRLRDVHRDLESLLQGEHDSLLARTRRLDGVFLRIGRVYQDWRENPAPPALDALSRQVEDTVLAYREAARAMSEHLSRPSDETRRKAQETLERAKTLLEVLGEMVDAGR